MKLTHYLYISTALALFAACSEEETLQPSYSVGEADNAIVLSAGIVQGGYAQTRAAGFSTVDATDNHNKHVSFAANTMMRIQVIGEWWKTESATAGDKVVKTSDATAGAIIENSTEKHRKLDLSTPLNWDDYGTADPNNTAEGRGRKKGLTIYGVAVDGATSALDSRISDLNGTEEWSTISWSVPSDQTGGWSTSDLLISNNIKVGGPDDTYKFDEVSAGKLLEFKHAMSKITVNLTPGEGFTDGKFVNNPTVTLLGFNTEGTVNITTGVPSPTASTTADFKTLTVVNGANSAKIITGTTGATAQFDAIVFPGNTFTATIADDAKKTPTSEVEILKLDADGNIYYVTAAQLVKAIAGTTTTGTPVSGTLEPGKNYVLNIKVNKTKIEVTATIKDWIIVNADTDTPKINVTAGVGDPTAVEATKQNMPSFDFYLSDASVTGATTLYEKKTTATKPSAGADGSSVWAFDSPLYWPNHQTHYFMRGVSPVNTSVSSGKIEVVSGDYNSGTSPTNLLVGAPVISTGTMCGNSDHIPVDMSTGGICAREGKINLTFDYMMSQVEVHLTTSSGESTPDDAVNLTGAKVEIVNGYTAGQVDIHSKTVAVTGSVADFTIAHVDTEDANYRHSIVVPQALSNGSGDLKFRVTIYKSVSTTDVDDIYYATIKDIKVTEPGETESKLISTWDRGKHYIYTLDLRKTKINVTATITNWIIVTGNENIWF